VQIGIEGEATERLIRKGGQDSFSFRTAVWGAMCPGGRRNNTRKTSFTETSSGKGGLVRSKSNDYPWTSKEDIIALAVLREIDQKKIRGKIRLEGNYSAKPRRRQILWVAGGRKNSSSQARSAGGS